MLHDCRSLQRFSFEKQLLATECVRTMTSVLVGSSAGKVSLIIFGEIWHECHAIGGHPE
jgi:hypothetical protein